MKKEMMLVLNANATPPAKTVTGAQRAGMILSLAFSPTLVSSAGAQVTLLSTFGTPAGGPARTNNPGAIGQGRDGNLYGTTLILTGGNNPNLGGIFKIT